ncbi:hypothetical protein [Hymenobacter sediminis]|nr:hypothetical protein [Hymenobacter sediminis]
MHWDYRRIAAQLTASGYRTRRGCHFTAGVRRLVLGLVSAAQPSE